MERAQREAGHRLQGPSRAAPFSAKLKLAQDPETGKWRVDFDEEWANKPREEAPAAELGANLQPVRLSSTGAPAVQTSRGTKALAGVRCCRVRVSGCGYPWKSEENGPRVRKVNDRTPTRAGKPTADRERIQRGSSTIT